MKIWILIIPVLAAIGVLIFLIYRHKKAVPKSGVSVSQDYKPVDVYMGLRNQAFTAQASSFGEDFKGTKPFGVIVEIGMDRGICTVVSFASGDASMYFSGGGGTIGGVGIPEVNKAAKEIVRVAELQTVKMKLTNQYPLVTKGNVRAYVLTDGKIYYDETALATITKTETPAGWMFLLVQKVLTGFRHHEESKSKQSQSN